MTANIEFAAILEKFNNFGFFDFFNNIRDADLGKSINSDEPDKLDFLRMLAPSATSKIEDMAVKARSFTLKHFGRTIYLYTPLYISDHCDNRCVYCCFNSQQDFQRTSLNLDQLHKEAEVISGLGFESILILTGESRANSSLDYIRGSVEVLKQYFSSIWVEIYPLSKDEYRELIDSGVDGLTIYQETYDRKIYSDVHAGGPKSDYDFRLDAPERAAMVGMRFINVGALLGLSNWRRDVFFAGLHAEFLAKKFPGVEISLSLPRFQSKGTGFIGTTVTDRDFVQALTALRLFLPFAGITISTRESADFRDNLMGLGVTRMSAQSSVSVGGHSSGQSHNQFNINDTRCLEDIKAAISSKGYQPGMKNWHRL